MRRFPWLALTLVLLSSSFAARAHAQMSASSAPPRSLEFELPNGLHVALEEDHLSPRVAVLVRYDVGSADDPPGHHGLAHLAEHEVFAGTRHLPSGGFFQALTEGGATQFNGITRPDDTTFYELLPAEQFARGLWIESERMGFALDGVDRHQFEIDRRIVLDELHFRTQGVALASLPRIVSDRVFPEGSRYHALGDDESDLGAMRVEDVQAFVQRHYVPDHAVLVAVGDFDVASARSLVEQYFGSIPRGPERIATPSTTVPNPGPPRRRELRVFTSASRVDVEIAWRTPAYFDDGDADLDVIAQLLTGWQNARLMRALRGSIRLGSSVTTTQMSMQHASEFRIRATAASRYEGRAIARAIEAAIDSLREGPISEAEITRARERMLARIRDSHGDLVIRAMRMADPPSHPPGTSYVARDLRRYQRVTAESVSRVARDWLAPEHAIVAIVEILPGTRLGGELARRSPSRGHH